jgi:GGDEF domain-containing protein
MDILCGSRLLREIGDLIKSHLRDIDTAYRYGGDEFIVMLPQTNKDSAMLVARRLCDLLNQTPIQLEQDVAVTNHCKFRRCLVSNGRDVQSRTGAYGRSGDVSREEPQLATESKVLEHAWPCKLLPVSSAGSPARCHLT